MKFGIIDITDCFNEIKLESKPLDISEEYASKAVKFLEKKLHCRFKLDGNKALMYKIHGQIFFARVCKNILKEDFSCYLTIYSTKLSPKDLLEIFSALIENGYCLRFLYFIDNNFDIFGSHFLKHDIKSLEKLFIDMELEA